MRNVLLAAVSAVAILGSSPEANAIAAGKEFPLIWGGHQIVFASSDYDGQVILSQRVGDYWVVGHPVIVANAPLWKTEMVDGTKYYFYGTSYDPYHTTHGLLSVPYSAWAGYSYYVMPNMLDRALDDAVKSPFNKVGTEVK